MSEPKANISEQLGAIIAQPVASRAATARAAAEAIRLAGRFRWTGIYDVTDDEICVVGWTGPAAPTFPRFPRTSGLNGAAVASRAPVIVQDVSRDSRYLTTISGTRAEMIVPVLEPGSDRVVGTLDVESDRVNAFGPADVALLTAAARALAPLWSRSASSVAEIR